MDRKYFISSAIGASAFLPAFMGLAHAAEKENLSHKIPAFLNTGDTIGITSPAGYITLEEIQPSILQIESWGFNIQIGSSIGKRDFTFGGTDKERLLDFQQMLDDPNINAIMCARGGYGFIRILDQIDFTHFKRHPKWIIGFSDITVLHCHISTKFGIASIHSKMSNSFPKDWSKADPTQVETILSIKKGLQGMPMVINAPYNPNNRLGKVDGIVVGGNLSIIENLAGSTSDLETRGKILFLEDTGEYLYSIDRMFWNLKRSGKLAKLKALIIGGFRMKPDDLGEEFGRTLYEIVLEKVKEYDYPISFEFPVGHQKNNFALKCGSRYTLDVNKDETILFD